MTRQTLCDQNILIFFRGFGCHTAILKLCSRKLEMKLKFWSVYYMYFTCVNWAKVSALCFVLKIVLHF